MARRRLNSGSRLTDVRDVNADACEWMRLTTSSRRDWVKNGPVVVTWCCQRVPRICPSWPSALLATGR
jgi:hypothetical protein